MNETKEQIIAHHRHLPRLARPFYQGHAFVHWTLTIRNREQGWLTQKFHNQFREILLHTEVRYYLTCPVYCLMPDHLHMIWIGLESMSDQRIAVEFFRKHTNPLLKPHAWQRQAHDHVLREEERTKNAFQKVAYYILENPVRAGLVAEASNYSYSGALVMGYPDLDPFVGSYWDVFWKIDDKLRKPL